MANSTITITFNSDAQPGKSIGFFINRPGQSIQYSQFMNFQLGPRDGLYRIQSVQTTTPPYTEYGEYTAKQYQYYFDNDYNGFGEYDVIRNKNVVTIATTDPNWTISGFHAPGFATAVISNADPLPEFKITNTDHVLQASSDTCNNFKLKIETTSLADNIFFNGVRYSDVTNPFLRDILRDKRYDFEVRKTTDGFTQKDFLSNIFVPKLSKAYLDLKVVKGVNGSSVTVSSNFPSEATYDLQLQYSLDNVTWTSSNKLTGQTPGVYTMHVKDNLGCKINFEYEVTESSSRELFSFISVASGINFVKVENVDDCRIYPNDENSFPNKDLNNIKYCDPIMFKNCDGLRTYQVKSNFKNVRATLRSEEETESELQVLKVSNNLDRFKSMDAIVYKYDDNLSGIYFESGNSYDETGIVIPGEEYVLSGNLPDMAIIGNIINVKDKGDFVIEDVITDTNINKKSILVKGNLAEYEEFLSTIVYSIYDLINYEIYEFSIDYSNLNGLYDVLVSNETGLADDENNVYYLSENINVQEEHYKTLAIEYYNKNNKDVFYKYGIKHFIRVGYEGVYLNNDDSIELSINDDSVHVINSDIKDGNRFVFDELTRAQAIKLIVALSCEYVNINGIDYRKKSAIKPESIENTNLYKIEAEMLKAGHSITNVGSIIRGSDTEFNFPPFLIGDGFVNI